MEHNGWTNYETWNIATIILNDETLYNLFHRIGKPDSLRDRVLEQTGLFPEGVLENLDEVNWAELAENI